MSNSSEAALAHLKKIKPLDGWAVEKAAKGYRLLRRNVPLTDNFFLDIHHDSTSGNVVGISTTRRNGKAQSQVLVDSKGKPSSAPRKMIQVDTWEPTAFFARSRSATTTTTTTQSATASVEGGTIPILSDAENMQLVKYVGLGVAALVVLKIILRGALLLYILGLPILYLYLVQTCPSDASFEAKRELKRVMRGHHLPDDHPDKPKGFLSETLARLNATVTAELATGLGYEITMINLAGAIKVACVRVPAAKMDYYWAGGAGRWMYVYSTELSEA